MGISRSATIVAAYTMREHACGVVDAMRAVLAIRPQAGPNAGFLRQLALFERLRWRIPCLTDADGHGSAAAEGGGGGGGGGAGSGSDVDVTAAAVAAAAAAAATAEYRVLLSVGVDDDGASWPAPTATACVRALSFAHARVSSACLRRVAGLPALLSLCITLPPDCIVDDDALSGLHSLQHLIVSSVIRARHARARRRRRAATMFVL